MNQSPGTIYFALLRRIRGLNRENLPRVGDSILGFCPKKRWMRAAEPSMDDQKFTIFHVFPEENDSFVNFFKKVLAGPSY
ncbi:hypothetical protein IMCC21224_11710 [Puniceibacterium sp. IMCC21224]|nr:hypothetical protein IMCC21224_11710 [Puniceibacterium sp. IMCC21224]